MQPRFSDIFIVSYGRTGSTLLQALLNTDPNADIEGENFGYLYHLYSAYRALQLSRDHLRDQEDRVSKPFYGASRLYRREHEQALVDIARRFLRHGSAEHVICGFKEIRYDLPDTVDYLEFLRRLSDRPCFVFLGRNHRDVLASGFMRQLNAAEAGSRLRAVERNFADFASLHSGNCFTVDYREIVSAGPELAALFARAGLHYDREKIDTTLAQKHSYDIKSTVLFNGSRLQISTRAVLDPLFLFYRLDQPSFEDANWVAIAGVLLPRVAGNAVSISCLTPGFESAAIGETGLPSPGLARSYPDIAEAAKARFAIRIPKSGGVQSIMLSVNGISVEFARFYPAVGMSQNSLSPNVAQTGKSQFQNSPD